MSETKSSKKDTRTRNWTCIIYPESAPSNWRDILDEQHIEWIESPLHDKDVNATGEPKKPHWHILLMFSGNKSYEQVKGITDLLNGPIPERCHSSKAMVRYFAHMDNPEKAQYSVLDIRGHGGVDIQEMLRPSSSERYTVIREILNFCRDNTITEFWVLMDYAQEHELDRWFPLLCDNCAFIVNQYIKSIRHSLKRSN